MHNSICTTCGAQFAAADQPPAQCPICADERQYVNQNGQSWTTLDELRGKHRAVVKGEEPGLTGIGSDPQFAIGQRALLVEAPSGNILLDCISLLDDTAIEAVQARGGISAIAISHPHYYSSMVEWSRAFGNVPIYIHAADRQWVMRPDAAVVFWEGETQRLGDGLTLIRCGGYFPGGTTLHWQNGADGRGVLLTGDIITVVQDRRYVSFMYSYPNLIPLPPAAVRHIVEVVEPWSFDRIYGAWFGSVVQGDAHAAVRRSAERYIGAIEGGISWL